MKTIKTMLLFWLFLLSSWQALARDTMVLPSSDPNAVPQMVYIDHSTLVLGAWGDYLEPFAVEDNGNNPIALPVYHPEELADDPDDLFYNPGDPNDRITESFDAKGQITHYGYDSLGRWNQTLYPDGTVELINYLEQGGYTVTRKDPVGQINRYEYGPQGELRVKVDVSAREAIFYVDDIGQKNQESSNGKDISSPPGSAIAPTADALDSGPPVELETVNVVAHYDNTPTYEDFVNQTYYTATTTSQTPPPNSTISTGGVNVAGGSGISQLIKGGFEWVVKAVSKGGKSISPPKKAPTKTTATTKNGAVGSGNSVGNNAPRNTPPATNGADPNKLKHIFEQEKHNLSGVVKQFGSEERAFNAIQKATEDAVGAQGLKGVFETTVQVGIETVTVRGRIVGGSVKIGTAFVP